MKNTYLSLVALAMAAASLSSCSRTNYAFNPHAPAYLGTTQARTVAKAPVVAAPAVAPEVTVVAPAAASAPGAVAPVAATAPAAAHPVAVQAAPAPAAPVAAVPVLAAATTPTAKPNLMQRLMLKKVLKRLTKTEARQNTAGTTQTAAKASLYLGVAAIGLVLLIIGLIAGSGFLDTVGGILIVVGLIIFIFNNV